MISTRVSYRIALELILTIARVIGRKAFRIPHDALDYFKLTTLLIMSRFDWST